ncbi:MAG: hypothetical protein PGN25_05810 [Methylorubrum populi]
MAGLSKAARQEIVREFAVRHNGHFNPKLFLEEVRHKGKDHPAFGWFEWDRAAAALAYQVEQAREFARDLRVSFTVQVVNGGRRSIQVRETAMPLVLSPVEGRRSGGGYILTDENDPAHMTEHCRQAAMALRAWLSRYRSAAEHAGCALAPVEKLADDLEKAAPRGNAAA